jgi:UDP-2,3-diacylglucosamine hydrolase
MKSAFFISDVHLRHLDSNEGKALISLVKKAQKQASLFVILGDLFDVWVGEGKAFQTHYAPLLEELRILRKECTVHYFEGNHDLYLTPFWQQHMGFHVHPGPHHFQFGDTKIWAEHGDEINRSDYGYLFLRRLLRTRLVKSTVQKLPSHLILKMGQKASHSSRRFTTHRGRDATHETKTRDLVRRYAMDLRTKVEFDLIVTGHTHIADNFCFTGPNNSAARLVNLGSWFPGPRYLELTTTGEAKEVLL